MAATAQDIGWGSTLTYQSGLIGRITGVSVANFGAREPRETSYMASTNGWRTFLPTDLKDPGELTVEAWFDKNMAGMKTAAAAAAETVTLTMPIHAGGSSAATAACSGFATSFGWEVPQDDVMSESVTIKLTGEPTMTDGS